jgi:hypothetical protein
MAAGVGEQLHDGRIYSHPAGSCRYRDTCQRYFGTQSFVAQEVINPAGLTTEKGAK